MNMFAIEEDKHPSELVLNAASVGRAVDLKNALDKGGDPDYVRLDIAPSLITAMRNFDECLEIVLQNGGHADIPNRSGWTALHEAAIKGDSVLLDIILKYPEQVKLASRDKDGQTAFFATIDANQLENAKLLLDADPTLLNTADNDGITPVLYAIKTKKTEWVDFLLDNGADLTIGEDKVHDALGSWEEGRELVARTRSIVIREKVAPVKQVVEDTVEEPVKSNPFGLGSVKKKTTGLSI